MEENKVTKENSKMGMGFLIGLLVAAVIGFGGYFVYNEFINKKSENKEETKQIQTENKEENKNTQTESNKEETKNIQVKINDYTVYSTESQKQLTVNNSGVLENVGFDSFSINSDGAVTLDITNPTLEGKYGKKYTVLNDVFSASLVRVGNAGFRTIVFAMKDGSVSFIEPVALINNKEIKIVKNVGNLTNIVQIEEYEVESEFDTVIGVRTVDNKGNTTDIGKLILN